MPVSLVPETWVEEYVAAELTSFRYEVDAACDLATEGLNSMGLVFRESGLLDSTDSLPDRLALDSSVLVIAAPSPHGTGDTACCGQNSTARPETQRLARISTVRSQGLRRQIGRRGSILLFQTVLPVPRQWLQCQWLRFHCRLRQPKVSKARSSSAANSNHSGMPLASHSSGTGVSSKPASCVVARDIAVGSGGKCGVAVGAGVDAGIAVGVSVAEGVAVGTGVVVAGWTKGVAVRDEGGYGLTFASKWEALGMSKSFNGALLHAIWQVMPVAHDRYGIRASGDLIREPREMALFVLEQAMMREGFGEYGAERGHLDVMVLERWNDAPERTFEEVKALLQSGLDYLKENWVIGNPAVWRCDHRRGACWCASGRLSDYYRDDS